MNRKLKVEELKRKNIEAFHSSKKFPIVLILEDIRSLNNIGSVFRTADAFAIEAIYLIGFSAKPPHREISKTAIGATKSVEWKYFENSEIAISELHKNGYSCYAIEQTVNSLDLNDFSMSIDHKVAFVLGNELTGVKQHTVNLCVKSIEIPQFGTKHSLNVSVCAGVVLWHCVHGILEMIVD